MAMPSLHPTRFSMFLAALCALGGLLLAGCATTTGEHDSDLPWATPESWEGSPAIPGFDQR